MKKPVKNRIAERMPSRPQPDNAPRQWQMAVVESREGGSEGWSHILWG